MTASSIEEAWAAQNMSYVAAGYAALSGNKDTIAAAYEKHQADVRAGYLAVLEEALAEHRGAACGAPFLAAGKPCCASPPCWKHALRDRIEALS